ncbi:MAG: hypothetical protein SPI83_05840 [Rothia sp. (in: high G+C Gram-positive bacteria)]|nr:hypothetical protein [Rothia sp. (in: high G+C Gram-positive bacteria)]
MTTSRRTLLQGATWAAPAVLATAAIPAYAASPSTTLVAQGSNDFYSFESAGSTDLVNFTGQTIQTLMEGGSTGFRLYQIDGTDTTALLTELTYYLLIPRNKAYTIDEVNIHYGVGATVWAPMKPSDQATVLLADGTTASSADFLIYTATYNSGPTYFIASSPAVSQAVEQTDISTNIAGRFTAEDGSMGVDGISGLYSGYLATYTYEGSSATVSTITHTARG